MTLRSKAPRVAGGLLLVCAAALAGCGAGPRESEAGDVELPPLSSTFESPEALARAVLDAFARQDVETLKSLPLTKEEFRLYVWPRLPASRPERNIPFEYGWTDLHQKSVSSIASNYKRYQGRKLELLSIGFEGDETDYETFVVRRKSELRVKDRESGDELTLALFGSVMEWKGRYKLFSYVTD
jgi:hypothetical protein